MDSRAVGDQQIRRLDVQWCTTGRGDATARFPARAGHVTVLRVDALEITAVEYVGDPVAITAIAAGGDHPEKSASE